MAIPTAVFLDTSIFAGQQYNFSSTAFQSFVPVAQNAGIKLLVPDPTEREIKRQIKQRSEEALRALEDARRKAPFLTKWEHYPKKASPNHQWVVDQVAKKELEEFLGQFDLVRLGYEGVSIESVMNWYDRTMPPFAEGKKRKEFPDAFAVAILSTYAERTGSYVAVVSEDKDFKAACERYGSLLYFSSLPRLTEVFVAGPSEIGRLREIILKDVKDLESYIEGEAKDLYYVHDDPNFSIRDTEVVEVRVTDLRIVAVGDKECTITFDALLESNHQLAWQDEVYSPRQETYVWEDLEQWVSNESEITGVAKLTIDIKAKSISDIVFSFIDNSEIVVTTEP